MQIYENIVNYLNYITENYRFDVVIKDITGFTSVDPDFEEALRPYLIHKNPFCMYVKTNRELWDRCIEMKYSISTKSQRIKKAFFGMCCCGVGEYVLPIIHNNTVIGVITAGEFRMKDNLSFYRIRKISKAYNLDIKELECKFLNSTKQEITDKELVTCLLGIVCEFFSGYYSTLISNNQDLKIKQIRVHSNEGYILSHAIEFIKQNYCEKIGVKDICTFCHCSESYINHIFKKNLKVNVKSYINNLKIEKAKAYLYESGDTVSEISNKVGFSDPNYFSSVFSKITGLSPREYRKGFRS